MPRNAIERWKGGELRVYKRFVEHREAKRQEVGGLEQPVYVQELRTELWDTVEAVPYGRGLALILDPGERSPSGHLSGLLHSGLRLEVEVRDGRPQCVSLRSRPGDPEVTPEALRFALDRAVSRLIEEHTVRLELDESGDIIGVLATSPQSPAEQRTAAERASDSREFYARPSGKRGRRPLSDEHLGEVLEVAENAIARKQPASRAIAERWTVAPSTARQWLYKARRNRAGRENDG